MATESSMTPLGTPLPPFTLRDLEGGLIASDDYTGNPLLVVFACNHCPYVRHVESVLGEVAGRHEDLFTVAICSNDVDAYPDDSPEHLAEQAERAEWGFPYLLDEDQEVARAFGATCTPDFFLFGADGRLAWRGAMDDATPGNDRPVTGELLEHAITEVLAGRSVPEPHRPSMGCSIKWRP